MPMNETIDVSTLRGWLADGGETAFLKVTVPTIVLHGARDGVSPPENSEGHARLFSLARPIGAASPRSPGISGRRSLRPR